MKRKQKRKSKYQYREIELKSWRSGVYKERYPDVMKCFYLCYPWEQVEYTLGKREFKRFVKWMSGQTCPIGGVFASDFERYLRGLPCID